MWCPSCQKEVVFGRPGPEVLKRARQGQIVLGGHYIPAPCPKCGDPLGWDTVFQDQEGPRAD